MSKMIHSGVMITDEQLLTDSGNVLRGRSSGAMT
jgi:hypothetical protein